MDLSGVLAPVCTAFSSDGEVCVNGLRRNIEKYCEAGLNGFVVAGSTGEAAFLNREERLRVFETVRKSCEGRTLIAGAGVESVRETVRLIGEAARIGYDAALVLTPHYYRAQMMRPETQIGFFQSVADASALPVLIYNFPQMTGIDLAADVVAQLAEHPNIVAIKESSADMGKVASLIAAVPKGFPVLVGASAKFYDALQLGAAGGILAIANVLPRAARLIYEGSAETQRRIVDAASVAPRYGIQGLKYAMDLKGFYGGPARLPLLPLDARQKAEIEELFRPIS